MIKISNLNLKFPQSNGNAIHVLRDINIEIKRGEILSIVGESGSGKSVFIKTLMGMAGSNAVFSSGSMDLFGQEYNFLEMKENDWQKIRGRKVSMIFQDPMNSLNPVLKIHKQFAEIFETHFNVHEKKVSFKMGIEYLKKVKINDPERVMNMYPHELSGGMKQRIVIAMVLACEPEVVLADEPTTAIDSTTQKEVLKLILDLQAEYKLTVIFITHDMGVVSQISDSIAVMYAGKIIEKGLRDEVIMNPQHPYTRALISAIPDRNKKQLEIIPGVPPVMSSEIKGDAFAPRNKFALEIDYIEEPPIFHITPTHYASTWLLDERSAEMKNKFDEYYRQKKVIK